MTTIFQGEDLIFYKGINGNIMSGGYDVESHMLRNGLAVPAGLYYITQPQSKPKNMAQHSYDKEHTPLSDDIFDKLYEMIEYNDKKKRKTKKQNLSVDKKHKKTKKQSFL
jgi:hypothetical protein